MKQKRAKSALRCPPKAELCVHAHPPAAVPRIQRRVRRKAQVLQVRLGFVEPGGHCPANLERRAIAYRTAKGEALEPRLRQSQALLAMRLGKALVQAQSLLWCELVGPRLFVFTAGLIQEVFWLRKVLSRRPFGRQC